jgi:hypothetical protein
MQTADDNIDAVQKYATLQGWLILILLSLKFSDDNLNIKIIDYLLK